MAQQPPIPAVPLSLVNGRDLVYQGKLPEPIIEDILLPKSLDLLSAEPFTGKTFYLMEMARAIATGTPFLGRYKTRRGAVLFIAADGSHWSYALQWKKIAGLTNRLEDQALDEPGDDPYPVHALMDRVWFSVLPGIGLNTAGVDRIAATAKAIEHSFGEYETGREEEVVDEEVVDEEVGISQGGRGSSSRATSAV